MSSLALEQAPLQAGMFPEFHDSYGRFGLQGGQMRAHGTILRNAGWYNLLGGKLGFGDLCAYDLAHVSHELGEGEAFIAMAKDASYDAFVERQGVVGTARDGDDVITHEIEFGSNPSAELVGIADRTGEMYPGLEYVALRGVIAVTRGKISFNSSAPASLEAMFKHAINNNYADTVGAQAAANADVVDAALTQEGLEASSYLRSLLVPQYDVRQYAASLETETLSAGDFMCQVLEHAGLTQSYFDTAALLRNATSANQRLIRASLLDKSWVADPSFYAAG